jgi:hypothetical protein
LRTVQISSHFVLWLARQFQKRPVRFCRRLDVRAIA